MRAVRALFVAACFVSVPLSACTSGSDSADNSQRPKPTPKVIIDAAPAVWALDRAQPLVDTATRFTALVTRLGCNNGLTGEVVRPGIEMTKEQIIVTFQVTPGVPKAANCPGNMPVPYTVELGEPIDGRELIDGRCLPGGDAETTYPCRSSRRSN